MSLKLVEENTGWEVALELAVEWEKNVRRLIKAVKNCDYKTAERLAEELDDDKEGAGIVKSFDGRAGR